MNREDNNARLRPSGVSFRRNALWIAFTAIVYFTAARLSLSLAFKPEGIAAIWPPEGVFLSAILLTRKEARPWLVGVLFVTDLIAELLAGTPWFVSAAYAAALTGSAVLSSWLLLRFVGEPITFGRVKEVLGFLVFAVVVSNGAMSLLAAAMSWFLPGTSFWDSWRWWAVSDGVGNLLVTPLVLSWASLARAGCGVWNAKRVLEGAALCLLLALVNYMAFGYLSEPGQVSMLFTYFTFPFLLLAALRLGVRGVTSASAVVAGIAIWFAAGRAAAASLPGPSLDAVITLQLYLASMAAPSLVLAAVVTERKRAEEELREINAHLEELVHQRTQTLQESETRFRQMTDLAQDAVIMMDPQGNITFWNAAAARMFEYSKEEALGKSLAETLIPPRYRAPHSAALPEWRKTGRGPVIGKIVELEGLRKGGQPLPIELSLGSVMLEGQWHAVGIVRDITDRKRAREQQVCSLRRLEGVNRLQENLLLPRPSEDKFKLITDTAVELFDLDFCRIWRIQASDLCDHGCIHATATDERHACRNREKCLHLVASSGRYTHLDGAHRCVPIGAYKIGRIAGGEHNKLLTNSVTTDPQVADHQWAKDLGLTSFAGYKLRDTDGDPVGVLAMFAKHPISEEEDTFLANLADTTSKVILESQLDEELRKAQGRADAANRAKSEFLANMSHEIRTPMTAIMGFTESLLDPHLSDADRYAAVDTIRRNGDYLLQVINDILDLSKIEAGKLAMEHVRFSPVQLAEEVHDLLKVRAEDKGLSLAVEYAEAVAEWIESDPTRLRQVLINVLGNAIKFTETGGVRLVVAMAKNAAGEPLLQFDVIDTGIGMTAQQIAALFQPFAQADASITRKFGGSGLGLAICKRLTQILGGDISVDSAPGQGSRFHVTVAAGSLEGVRLVDGHAEAARLETGGARKPAAVSPTDQLDCRVLLAEDAPDNQRLIGFVLEKAGARVTVAENGQVACEVATAAWKSGQAFDVILMDMQMPVLDGYAAARRLRGEGYPGVIIALTAHAMAEDRTRCLEAGCNDYTTKPIDRKGLLETVARYVAKPSTGIGAAV